ncbi:MAG: peptidoglycan DD-metalloendopeptidase family protein [Bacteroidaceae bacterium]|nr:peptidoglycan DD-metalloendopeptidase family protein [Bacteroidaceae bacterium]MBO5933245.1 peptidoglycan DD-metalloendopeptidase family protein [Bacteroidaceae bacterium]MBO5952038.1 peptidoglycan DD-metalloendopeptidase family protein [Bacteroidaceae bacterium]MBR4303491.1 peptidoglycan DD-metalloendopeptidase family protein [Bacteroidaceae bacterium]
MVAGVLFAAVSYAGEPVSSQVIPLTAMPTVECPAHLSVGIAYNLDNPASFLYPEWSNQYVHKFDDVPFPDSLVIMMKDFCMPTDSTRITDKYGYRPRRTRVHYGLDVKVLTGDTIRSAFDGKVRISRYERRGYGHYLVIRHPNGLETVYAHLSKKLVKENQIVRAGEPIGLGGNTGRSTGSHLHFETRILGKPINPAFMFNFPEQCAETDVYVYRKADNKEVYYKVRSGDTLTRIAAKNETSVSAICKLNGISRNTILRVGQTLRVN